MKLKEGKNHHVYEVVGMDVELDLERRLCSLGLTTGTRVTILNNDKKGAVTVKFRGTRFAVGKRIASNITVKEAAV